MSEKIPFYKKGYNGSIKRSKNQKAIKIHRKLGGITFEINYKVLGDLSANAYVLYMYLIMLPEKSVWMLSSKHVYERTALTKNTYPDAIRELIQKRYLTEGPIEVGSEIWTENTYHMWEEPLPENQVSED